MTDTLSYLMKKLVQFDTAFPGALQPEWLDWLDVVEMGAKKYKMNNWLETDGYHTSRKDMHGSISRHIAQSYVEGHKAKDKESGLHPNLHTICRAQMQYTRDKRKIVNSKDEKKIKDGDTCTQCEFPSNTPAHYLICDVKK